MDLTLCKRCGQPVPHPAQIFCGAACTAKWEAGDRGIREAEMPWTRSEAKGATEALKNLLENLGFTHVATKWPMGNWTNLPDNLSQVMAYAEFTTTKAQRRINHVSYPVFHIQILEALDGKQAEESVSFGAGKYWYYGFRVVEADRPRPIAEGVVQIKVEITKKPHPNPFHCLSRTPKWT